MILKRELVLAFCVVETACYYHTHELLCSEIVELTRVFAQDVLVQRAI